MARWGMVCGLVSTVALAQPVVQLFPAVGTTRQVTLAGRVLKSGPTGGSSTVTRNLRRLSASNWEGAPVEVRFLGQKGNVTSGHDGNFEVTFSASDRPFPVGLSVAEAAVRGAEPARATVDVMSPGAPFFVISDFDDTVAVTNVVDTSKFVTTVFGQDEQTQQVVEGMAPFYRCLRDQPERPVFALVSGSPVQFHARVSRFLQRHDFPVFGQYLRDLGPTTLSGYKQPVIRALLRALPGPVVLVGDSGEKDPEVYAQLRAEFPDRVRAIFIRDAGHASDPTRFAQMTLFSHPREAARAAAVQGLILPSCAAGLELADGGR
ncbi:MAG: DUF2183 domain-containing protein [Myxococcaceae bacterium]|jgi:phosphatidate phosphatase APP1|nr:DUF2183 domain-containing protein [Myxococcaceae bacterium]